jgi:hypothetical protein
MREVVFTLGTPHVPGSQPGGTNKASRRKRDLQPGGGQFQATSGTSISDPRSVKV